MGSIIGAAWEELSSVAEAEFDSLGFTYVRFFIRSSDSPLMRSHLYKVDTGANSTTISRK